MSTKYCYLLLLFFSGLSNAFAQDFTTLTYFSQDSETLELDLFLPENPDSLRTPILIYVHGGGFATGDRTEGHALASYLQDRGIACASISYTLHMKDQSFSCDGILTEKIKAIQIAANQLWLATAFLLEHQDTLLIDTTKIFIGGISAGAETVLHAAFWDREIMELYGNQLGADFTYAGIVAGAGAIMDLNLITPTSQIPVLAYHGDADPIVPYETAAHHFCPTNAPGWLMLFGSYSIANHLAEQDGSCHLITFLGGDHSLADAYIRQDHQPIYNFMQRVLAGERFILHQFMDASRMR
jgi:predicted esterase